MSCKLWEKLLSTLYVKDCRDLNDIFSIQSLFLSLVSTSSDIKTGIRCLQISPDGQLLAAGDRSGNLRYACIY